MSIPKILHCGRFANWKLTPLEEHCRASWRQMLPDYEIREWTDETGPILNRFFTEACRLRPVNAANFIRYWSLEKFGGVYLDNDVQVVQPFDLAPACFLGFQRDDSSQDCVNTAVLASEPGHPFIAQCLARTEWDNPNTWPVWLGCGLPQEELEKIILGPLALNVETEIAGITVYEKSRFYPWRWDETPDMSRVGLKTFAIHWCGGSWK